MTDTFTTYYHSPAGVLKISGTDDYIQEVIFSEKSAIPETIPDYIPALLINCTEQLIQYFNGGLKQFDLPLNQPGTPFQQKVWNELLNIPFGKTTTYLKMAVRLGDVKVIRAAASANGKNNIAIIVPCHRVIGSNNSLVGYAGGLPRKKWLLGHEAKYTYGVQTLF